MALAGNHEGGEADITDGPSRDVRCMLMISQNTAQAAGRAGERWFQFILPHEWVFHPPREDIGLDGKVIIVAPERNVSGLEFDVQIKASADWKINAGGSIPVDGLNLATIKHWESRLYPVMLVLYDMTREIGYYTWINETWEKRDPIEYLRSKAKTITLPVDSRKVLSKDAWEPVKDAVFKHYERIATTYEKLNFLPFVHMMTSCLWHLQKGLLAEAPTNEERRQEDINVLVSYRNLLAALQEIAKRYSFVVESDFSAKVAAFHDDMTADVESFIPDFRELCQGVAHPANLTLDETAYRKKTPYLILAVLGFLMDITKREGILHHYFQEQYSRNRTSEPAKG